MQKLHPTLAGLLDTAQRDVDGATGAAPTGSAGRAGQLYCDRRKREAWFEGGMFWEPGWDLILYLYDAHEAGQPSVSLRTLSKTPFTVSDESTLRWLDLLISNGYITTNDGMKAVTLTAKAIAAIGGYLGSTEHA